MQTEMHGSFTEHRGSRLAPLSVRVGGDNGEEGRAPLFCLFWILLHCFCVNLSVLFCVCNAASLAVLTLVSPLFSPHVSKPDFGPKRVGAGCSGQQEDAFPQLRWHAWLRGDAVVQGPTGCHRPGAGPPVSPAVRMGQTLEQSGHRLTHTPLPASVQLPIQ